MEGLVFQGGVCEENSATQLLLIRGKLFGFLIIRAHIYYYKLRDEGLCFQTRFWLLRIIGIQEAKAMCFQTWSGYLEWDTPTLVLVIGSHCIEHEKQNTHERAMTDEQDVALLFVLLWF